jgi:hypothetical protein
MLKSNNTTTTNPISAGATAAGYNPPGVKHTQAFLLPPIIALGPNTQSLPCAASQALAVPVDSTTQHDTAQQQETCQTHH